MLMNVSGFSDSPKRLDAWLYLDEVTHRALNDYTAMLAIVRRASSTITDKVGLAALGDVARRLESAAQTYRALRPSWASSMRNLEDDLERLCASLTSAILADRAINLTLTSEPVSLSAKRCWQISLVISELVMNAAKHAFSKSGGGEIVVRVRAVGDMLQCAVIDDGSAGPNYAPGRGSGIVDALAADLGGCIVRRLSRNGSTIILSIPMDQPDAVLRRRNLPLVGIAPAGLPVASEADSGTTDRLDERLDEAATALPSGVNVSTAKIASATGTAIPDLGCSRRTLLIGAGAIGLAASGFGSSLESFAATPLEEGAPNMSKFTTSDGAEIFYKDWGSGQPIVFSHGWPLSADDWDAQMLFFLHQGYRVIAHDRRGHGRSSQTSGGHDMDHYAADLAALAKHLDLKAAVHVGHSTGGGEVAAYVGRHGESRVAKVVLVGAVPPVMVKKASNPGGTPLSVFDEFRAALAANRAQFFIDVPSGPFYGFNRPGAKISEGAIRNWWRQGMMGAANAHYDCIKAFSETDFTEDLRKITAPTLIMHGDDDQVVPIADSALLSAKLVKNSILKVYKGYPHGMCTTHAEQINKDLLAFVRS